MGRVCGLTVLILSAIKTKNRSYSAYWYHTSYSLCSTLSITTETFVSSYLSIIHLYVSSFTIL